jgi:hypothetical protein
MINQLKKWFVGSMAFVCLVSFLTISLQAKQAQADKKNLEIAKILPDLIVKSVKVTKTGETSTGDHQVKIEAVVMNVIPKSSVGAFKVKCEFTENPTTGYTFLSHAGVISLSYSPAIATIPAKTLTFTHVVPRGKAYKYAVTADYTTLITECKEDNNVTNGAYNNL